METRVQPHDTMLSHYFLSDLPHRLGAVGWLSLQSGLQGVSWVAEEPCENSSKSTRDENSELYLWISHSVIIVLGLIGLTDASLPF